MTNERIVLSSYPQSQPRAEDFTIDVADARDPGEGEVLIETQWLSMDPAPRLRMNAGSGFPPPIRLGDTVPGRGVGIVRATRDPTLREGEIVAGELGWQTLSTVAASQLRRVDPTLAPVQTALGVLGPSGITAWLLVREAARVRAGDTVVVAAAAGSVGSIAVQLAKLAGARVVGIVGSQRQADFVRGQLGAAATVDYHSVDLDAELAATLPAGADVFLDSVGGRLHESVLMHIADHARIVAFGYISAYHLGSAEQPEYGRIYQLIRRRAHLSGFLVGDHAALFAEAVRDLATLLADARLCNVETVSEGLASVPTAFAALFSGDPVGKQLVRIGKVP